MIVLHTTSDSNGQPWPDAETTDRIVPAILRLFAYTARTELFLMIACFLLVISIQNRPRTYVTTIKEQSRRLLLPFLFWTVFYAAFNAIKATQFGYIDAHIVEIQNPNSWSGYLLLGNVKYHMHFLPTLFGLLLFYPAFLWAYRVPALGVLLLPCLLLKWILDAYVWSTYWDTEILPFLVRIVKIMTYVGYGLAAAALAKIWTTFDRDNLQYWALPASLCAAFLLVFKAKLSYETILSGQYRFDDIGAFWADFLMPVLLFLLCMSLWARAWPNVLGTVGRYSFGMYLCHPIFLDLSEILLLGTVWSPTQLIVAKLSLTIFSTSVLVYLLGQSRLLGWTIGLAPFPQILPSKTGRKPYAH